MAKEAIKKKGEKTVFSIGQLDISTWKKHET